MELLLIESVIRENDLSFQFHFSFVIAAEQNI